MISSFINLFRGQVFLDAVNIFVSLTWLWLPIVLGSVCFWSWIRYIQTRYIDEQGSVLLELKLPKEITKSPSAMELIIGSMSQPSVGNFVDVYLKGKVRAWFSLELVSLGGEVHFYIWCHSKFKNGIEAQIYSQFPTVEIHEIEDYTNAFRYNPLENSVWGMQLKLTKPDAYPIKTYIEYGLDKDPDEEFKIDPLTPLIEFLGSLKPSEQVWIQILIQAHKKETLKDLRVREKPNWMKNIDDEIKKIIKEKTLAAPEEGKTPSMRDLSDSQKDVIASMQRNAGKTAFEVMIRGLYLAPKDLFNPNNIGGLTGGFKQFGSESLNGFAPKLTTSFDYPWQDFRGKKLADLKYSMFDSYRRRSYFHSPYEKMGGAPFILTTEELATLFHFPGGVAATPTLSRTQSRKGEAPSNLPV